MRFEFVDDFHRPHFRRTGDRATRKGGTQQINSDLLANTLMNWSSLYAAAARNRAALETMKSAADMGIAYQVPADTKGAIKVMRDGVAEHWAVEDPYLLDAISAMAYTPNSVINAAVEACVCWVCVDALPS